MTPNEEAIEKSVLKLIDFGLAREFAPDQARKRHYSMLFEAV